MAARLTGISEIDYERRKAEGLRGQASRTPQKHDLERVDAHATDAAARCADFISVRRLAELIGVRSWSDLSAFRQLLLAERARRYRPPIYRV